MSQHEQNKSLTVDWLTPPYITEALPVFDLDPCASTHQTLATARRMIVLPEDGLQVKWEGSIWLNPPYGHKQIAPWMRRMARHNNGVALVFARVETKWFHRLVWPFASGFFFFEGRLSFVHGQALTDRQK
ncbi:MAG TPA: DNA N-6-adenine-methyltransferase, partial [Blastocatellia bacterium]